MMYIKR